MQAWTAMAIAAMGLSLLLACAHPFGDAHLRESSTQQPSLMEGAPVPRSVRALLIQKCADCHSDETRSPLYAKFAPVSWLVERDVMEGRRHMDLSHWASMTADQQEQMASKIVGETSMRSMPPLQYRIIHWSARITGSDVEMLTAWARGQSDRGDEGTVATNDPPAGIGDAVHGKLVFEKRCTGCHSLTQNREGPKLGGVYGRVSGTVDGFAYSDALKKAKMTWDEKTLNKWLADPDALVPDNNMEFHVAKAEERRDVIAYLRQPPLH